MAVNEKAELPPVKVIREVMDKRTAAQICQWRAEREGRGEIARAILAEGADPQAVTRDIAGLLKAVASHPPYEPGQKTVSMRSPLSGWLGGKFLLSKRLVALLPRHVCYVEPFSGAAWLLFRKRRSPVEVINDINRDIVALYRTVRDNPCYIREQVRWSLHSRQLFEEALMADTDRMSEAERAWRFLYLLKGSFGGGRGLGDWSGGNERISQEMRRQKLAAGNAGAPQGRSTGGGPGPASDGASSTQNGENFAGKSDSSTRNGASSTGNTHKENAISDFPGAASLAAWPESAPRECAISLAYARQPKNPGGEATGNMGALQNAWAGAASQSPRSVRAWSGPGQSARLLPTASGPEGVAASCNPEGANIPPNPEGVEAAPGPDGPSPARNPADGPNRRRSTGGISCESSTLKERQDCAIAAENPANRADSTLKEQQDCAVSPQGSTGNACENRNAPQARSTGAPSITFGSTQQAHDCPLDPLKAGVNACGRDLPDFVERLKRVIIEHLPYAEVFARYDSPDTFFYVDPPYVDREDYYGKGRFSPDDFAKLRDILAGLKGKFILSLNDHPKAREIFGEFRMETGETTYGLNNVRPTKATELLFMNYDPASACQLAPAPEENAPAPRRKRKKYYEPDQAPLLFSGLSASSTGKPG